MTKTTSYLAAVAVFIFTNTLDAAPLGTSFTYQGNLAQSGTNVSDICDFRFALWDASSGGAEVTSAIDVPNVSVVDGTFTVNLDFGGGLFDGDARWLEIAVACPTGGGLTTLAPRQELTPSPNAIYAANAGAMQWSGLLDIPADLADGDDVDDNDADPSNELQDLTLGGNTLSLTDDVSPVDLSEYLDNTDDQTLAEVLAQENDAAGTTIDNLPEPLEDAQAATKAYVDSQTDNQTLAEVLAEGNDAGGLTISNLPEPVEDFDASNKAYVDAQAGEQTLAEVLSQSNDASGITITNLPGPTAASDASTKGYTDAHTDEDADSTNELQDLSLGGNTLSLTDDLTTVDLSGYLDNTDDQTLAEVLAQSNNAGGASISNIGATTTNALTVSGLDCTVNANGGALTTNASGLVLCSDDDTGAGGGNSLDAAYDQGGAGAGRFIVADSGAVTITGAGGPALDLVSDFDPVLRVSSSSSLGEDTGLEIVGARNSTTTVDVAFIDLKDFDDNEGAGTEFSMARIGAGMQDAEGQTGFLRFYTNAGADLQEHMRIDKNGNISIGTDSTTETLDVAGDAMIGGGLLLDREDGSSEFLRIRGNAASWYLGTRNTTFLDSNFFIGSAEDDFDTFHLDLFGNLGLGTVPAADLHLASTGSQQILIEADTDNSGESDQPSLVFSQDGGLIDASFGYLEGRNHLSIRTQDVGAGLSHLLLEPEGRVGVGTESPQNKLDVQGPGTTAGGESGQVVARFRNTTADQNTGLSIDALADQESVLYFADGGSATWTIRNDPDDPDFNFPTLAFRYIGDSGAGNAIKLVTGGPGDFAIYPGWDNETSLGGSGLGGPFGAWESVASYAFNLASDVRVKSDVRELDYGIEAISRLRPVRFRWSAHPEDGDRLGVIAQEVELVIPEVVSFDANDPDRHLTVDYTEFVPVLIRALQEQQHEIESLRSLVESLQSNVQELAENQALGTFEAVGKYEIQGFGDTTQNPPSRWNPLPLAGCVEASGWPMVPVNVNSPPLERPPPASMVLFVITKSPLVGGPASIAVAITIPNSAAAADIFGIRFSS